MNIEKQRTRLIFSDFDPSEHRKIEDTVAAMDNVFMYYDPDKHTIALPTGMEKTFRRIFPKAKFIDNSDQYWDYAKITPVEHSAKPRNQLQIDFINFVLEKAKNKQKLAGILGTGTGKGHPLTEQIPTPNGWKLFGDLQIGDEIFSVKNRITNVTGIHPLGKVDIWQLTFSDGRTVRCTDEHLWNIRIEDEIKYTTIKLIELLPIFNNCQTECKSIYVPCYPADITIGEFQYAMQREAIISKIELIGQEESQCITVDDPSQLYAIDDFILTHNTFMACYSAIATGMRTLFIAPTSGIKEQWADTLTKMFKVPPERVLNVKSPKEFIHVTADFVIISQASLASLNKNYDLEKIMKDNKFGIKVVDEVQMWFKNIVQVDGNSNIANNWYLTGTFGRSGDEENRLYQEMFGDLAIFREKQKTPTIFNPRPGNIYGMKPYNHTTMVWTKSGLSKAQIKKVTSSMRYSERLGKWMRYGISLPAYTEEVIPSDGRMTPWLRSVLKTVQIAEHQVQYGSTLVLTPTIASAEIICKHLQRIFPDKKIGTYHSRHPKQVNDENKATCNILVSTSKSAGTGFDIKGLAKLIIAEQVKSWILISQLIGRNRRRDDGRDTYAWDIVDSQIPQLRAWARARADVERRISKSFKVVDIDL